MFAFYYEYMYRLVILMQNQLFSFCFFFICFVNIYYMCADVMRYTYDVQNSKDFLSNFIKRTKKCGAYKLQILVVFFNELISLIY